MREASATRSRWPNTSPGADEIAFSVTGEIKIDSQLPTITDALTITGPGAALLTIDAGNGADNTISTHDGYRIFNVDDGAESLIEVSLTGLTLTGGDVLGYGGALFNREDLTLIDSTLLGNSVKSGGGGGVYNGAGAVATTSGSTFTGNSAYGFGGGVYNEGTVAITHSTFSGNMGSGGGGVMNSYVATITNSTFSGNSGNGGAIYNWVGAVTITRSTLSGNAGFQGGGVHNESTATIFDSTLTGNWASNSGGVFNGFSLATATIIGSTFSGNRASSGGGVWNDGTVTVTHSTFTGNWNITGGKGGGVSNLDTMTITHSIIANSVRGSDLDDFFRGLNGAFNVVGDGSELGRFTNSIAGDTLLGPLADNGGPTLTHALLPGSPAIDAGDPAFSSPPDFDQRGAGFARIVNGGGAVRLDIGAYESQGIPSFPLGDYNHNGVADAADYTVWRDTLDGAADLRANGDNTGASADKIDEADYLFWRAHYGNTTVPVTPAPAPLAKPAAEAAFAQWLAPSIAVTASEADTPVAASPNLPADRGILLLLALDQATTESDREDGSHGFVAEGGQPKAESDELETLAVALGEFW